MLIVSGPSIIVRFQTQLALLFLLLSGGDNRSAKGGISYVLALMEGELSLKVSFFRAIY
jgi:hypothetical protein